ncbi:hypothetical protein CgunFtcFv8_005206 [Champsocephalus gunnari]|uniref:Uncharacterized protein n=2 Tax=Champsocephalus gunnari TaxID=52237 RepID=A0AAN8CX01_CHAGU|nr:hypothetical protein CgunFtcFv8_005206 [Champsocephalus gunnari]
MENTKMMVLSACLIFMILGCTQEEPVANATVTSNNTTPPLGHTSGPLISNNLSAPSTAGLPPPTTTTTTPITSSRQPTKSSGASSPAHTCHHLSSAATSASFFGPCSQVLVTVLIGCALL